MNCGLFTHSASTVNSRKYHSSTFFHSQFLLFKITTRILCPATNCLPRFSSGAVCRFYRKQISFLRWFSALFISAVRSRVGQQLLIEIQFSPLMRVFWAPHFNTYLEKLVWNTRIKKKRKLFKYALMRFLLLCFVFINIQLVAKRVHLLCFNFLWI